MRKETIIHAVFLLSTAMPVTQALCQSTGHNYVMTETPLDEDGANRVTAVEYMDGLGRPVETVTDGLGTDGSFAWSTRVYDIMGRVTSERLPGVSAGQPDYKTDTEALALSQQSNGGDQFPFTDVSYDYSGRETVSFGPGTGCLSY